MGIVQKSTNKKAKKGFSNVIWMIVFAVIALGVLGIANTYMADIIETEHEDQCPYSYVTIGNGASGNLGGNHPTTGGNWGCCQTLAASNNCTTWYSSGAINVSFESMEAQENIGEKQGTLSNVTMAGAIIMILLAAFGSVALYSRKR